MMNNGPMSGKMVGLTHREDGSLIIKSPKLLKVSIGWPKGPALNVWTQRMPDNSVVWKLMLGYKSDEAKTATFKTRAEAEAKFREAYPKAPVCPYPRKIAYFTFTKPSIIDGKEQYVPDFDAIEAHGPTPTEIDVILLSDTPLDGAYQMWSSSELQCKGDGVNALRVVTLATAEEKPLVLPGEKYFPIHEGCWTCGCRYAQPGTKNGKETPSPCKPGGELSFQLACNLRVGGTAFFHTTGLRSISSIFSSLFQISTLTGGRLMGIPLKMVLRPFRTNHNGQAATHYAVSLEFRAPDVDTMKKKLLDTVFEYRKLAGVTPALASQEIRLIDAPETDGEEDDDVPEGGVETVTVPVASAMSAEAMAGEFYPEQDGVPDPEPPIPAAAATQAKTATLAERLTKAKTNKPAAETPASMAPAATPAATVDPSKGDLF